MSSEFTLLVGDNAYGVSGAEAAWYAYQCACALADCVGGEAVSLWTTDEDKNSILVAIN